ncbi:MAG: hypothetical protein ACRC6X_04525 [Culicoidibacterales bacterium]
MKNKQIKKMLQIFMVIQCVLIVGLIYQNWTTIPVLRELVNQSATAGVVILGLLLATNNIYLANKNQFKYLKWVNQNQREIGLVAFYFVIFHVIVRDIIWLVLGYNLAVIFVNVALAVFVLVFMYITSFKPIQKHIKKWKKYHQLIWLAIPLIFYHTLQASGGKINLLILAIYLGCVLSSVYANKYAQNKSRTARQLQYLAGGTALAIVQYIVMMIIS